MAVPPLALAGRSLASPQPAPPELLLQVFHPSLQHLAAAGRRRRLLAMQLGLCRWAGCGGWVGGWQGGLQEALQQPTPSRAAHPSAPTRARTCGLQALGQLLHFVLQPIAALLCGRQARAALLHRALQGRQAGAGARQRAVQLLLPRGCRQAGGVDSGTLLAQERGRAARAAPSDGVRESAAAPLSNCQQTGVHRKPPGHAAAPEALRVAVCAARSSSSRCSIASTSRRSVCSSWPSLACRRWGAGRQAGRWGCKGQRAGARCVCGSQTEQGRASAQQRLRSGVAAGHRASPCALLQTARWPPAAAPAGSPTRRPAPPPPPAAAAPPPAGQRRRPPPPAPPPRRWPAPPACGPGRPPGEKCGRSPPAPARRTETAAPPAAGSLRSERAQRAAGAGVVSGGGQASKLRRGRVRAKVGSYSYSGASSAPLPLGSAPPTASTHLPGTAPAASSAAQPSSSVAPRAALLCRRRRPPPPLPRPPALQPPRRRLQPRQLRPPRPLLPPGLPHWCCCCCGCGRLAKEGGRRRCLQRQQLVPAAPG